MHETSPTYYIASIAQHSHLAFHHNKTFVIQSKTLIMRHTITIAMKLNKEKYSIKSPWKTNTMILDLASNTTSVAADHRSKNPYQQIHPFDHLSPSSNSKIKRSTWLIASFNHVTHNKHLISPFFQNYFCTDECMSLFRHLHT